MSNAWLVQNRLLSALALRVWLLSSQNSGQGEPPSVGCSAHPVGSTPASRTGGPRRAEFGAGQPSPLRQLAADLVWIVQSWLRPAGSVAEWQQSSERRTP